MAGVTNYPYRKICRDFGAGLCITEMVSARALKENHWRTQEIAEFGPEESPRSLQIFGSEPAVMAEAVELVRDRVDHLDINFGCPAPKVMRRGAGAVIPANPDLCRAVVRATVKAAAGVPVSVKLRLGLDEERFTFREAARIAEGEGCAYIGLHARTVAQRYSGNARWDYIAELVNQVRIPVLGNGDVFRAEDAFRLMERTGCQGVIIGRGCLGNPWLFGDLKRIFDGTGGPVAPTLEEVISIIRLHYRLLREHFSYPRAADVAMRKFGTWYARGLRNATAIRRQFQTIDGPEDLERVLAAMAAAGWQDGFRPFEPAEAGAPAECEDRAA
jgi:nifR3 family TIM-barrel protein